MVIGVVSVVVVVSSFGFACFAAKAFDAFEPTSRFPHISFLNVTEEEEEKEEEKEKEKEDDAVEGPSFPES